MVYHLIAMKISLIFSKGEELCKYITEMMFQTSLRTSTRIYLTELQAMMAKRPIAYGCFDIFRLTTMNAFKVSLHVSRKRWMNSTIYMYFHRFFLVLSGGCCLDDAIGYIAQKGLRIIDW